MTETARTARNRQRLTELYPTMAKKVAAIIKDLEGHQLRPRIQSAYRSPADQLAAYNAGHSKLKYGFHNVTGPGGEPESLAVDLLDDNHPTNMGSRYLLMVAAAAQAHSCITGIRWGLPAAMAKAIDAAIAAKNWDAPVKVGWDPTHIQPTGLTPQAAKAGKRPK